MKRAALLGLVGVALLFAFQNCLPGAVNSSMQAPSGKTGEAGVDSPFAPPDTSNPPGAPPNRSGGIGNADGYDGKTFVNRVWNGTCPDGSELRSEIVITDRGALLIRENCAAIPPVPVRFDDLNLMPHNPSNLIFEGHAFDLKPPAAPPKPTTLLCRGINQFVDPEERTQGVEVNDVIINGNSADGFSGKVLVGIYSDRHDLNRLITFDTGVLSFEHRNLDGTVETESVVPPQIFGATYSRYGRFELEVNTRSSHRNPLASGSKGVPALLVYTPSSARLARLNRDRFSEASSDPSLIPEFSLPMECFRQ